MQDILISQILGLSVIPENISDRKRVEAIFEHAYSIDEDWGVGEWVVDNFIPALYAYFEEREEILVAQSVALMKELDELKKGEEQ